jgi:hypothetical protein
MRNLLSVVLSVGLLAGVACAEPSPIEFGTGLFGYLQSVHALNDDFDDQLRRSTISIGHATKWGAVAINAPYTAHDLNLYVVDIALRGSDLPPSRFKSLVAAAKDNFIAVPPNIILADRTAIAKLFGSVFESMSASQQAVLISILRKGVDPQTGGKKRIETRDYIPIAAMLNALRSQRLLTLYGTLLSDRSSYAEFASMIKDRPPDVDVAHVDQIYAAALAPLMLHEVAHLMNRDLGGFLHSLREFLREPFGPSVRRREDGADHYAITLLHDFLKNPESTDAAVNAAGVMAFTTYLSARIWSSVFGGFRGPGSEQFLWSFDRVPCDQWASYIAEMRKHWQIVADAAHVEQNDAWLGHLLSLEDDPKTNLQNPLLVRDGWEVDFPIVSAEEFGGLKKRVQESFGDGSHAPHFVRAFHFSDVSAELYKDATVAMSLPSQDVTAEQMRKDWFKREMSVVDAVTTGDPSLIKPEQALARKGSVSLSEQALREYFKNVYSFEEGVNCPPHACLIGKMKSGRDGFIEITRGAAGITRIRVGARFGQSGDDKYFNERALQEETRRREATPFFYLMALVTDAVIDAGRIAEKDGLEASEGAVSSLQKQLGSCMIASSTVSLADVSMHFETGYDGWISLSVDASD